MKIAVVIPALDEAERVAEAVESARAAADPGPSAAPGADGVEVVVVDGGSRDDTARRAVAAGARVIEAPAGRAGQLAAGARATGGDVVLFLHADTRLPGGWVRAVHTALREPEVVGGAFALRFDRGARRDARAPRAGGVLGLIEGGARLRGRLLSLPYGDQGLFVRRSVLEAIGGVPQVPILEDLDLVAALKRRGRLALLPLAVESSARRYEGRPLRQMLRNWLALAAWALGVDRRRIAGWYGR